MRQFNRQKKGFTLIELLVVIAVIALLLSVVMPALRSAKNHARTVVCSTRLRQIFLATTLYHMDNDYKRFTLRMSAETDARYWMVPLAPYIGDELGVPGNVAEVMPLIICPSSPMGNFVPDSALEVGPGWFGRFDRPFRYGKGSNPIYGSYTCNTWWTLDDRDQTRRNMSVNSPESFPDWNRLGSDVPLFGDGVWPEGPPRNTDKQFKPTLAELRGGAHRGVYTGGLGESSPGLWRFAVDRHNMRINVLFKDGTVKPVHLERFYDVRWANNWVRESQDLVYK